MTDMAFATESKRGPAGKKNLLNLSQDGYGMAIHKHTHGHTHTLTRAGEERRGSWCRGMQMKA